MHYDRPFGQYRQPKWTSYHDRDECEWTGPFLNNTNETIHPIVRYRHFCKRNARLGNNDKVPYDPTTLGKDILYPRAQEDGRIGRDPQDPQAPSEDPLSYTFTRKETGKSDVKVHFTESVMGKWERLYLAFYHEHDKSANIWGQVVGGT